VGSEFGSFGVKSDRFLEGTSSDISERELLIGKGQGDLICFVFQNNNRESIR